MRRKVAFGLRFIHAQAAGSHPAAGVSDAALFQEGLQLPVLAEASMQMSSLMRGKGEKWEALFYMFRDEVKGTRDKPGLEEYIYRYGYGKKVKT